MNGRDFYKQVPDLCYYTLLLHKMKLEVEQIVTCQHGHYGILNVMKTLFFFNFREKSMEGDRSVHLK